MNDETITLEMTGAEMVALTQCLGLVLLKDPMNAPVVQALLAKVTMAKASKASDGDALGEKIQDIMSGEDG